LVPHALIGVVAQSVPRGKSGTSFLISR
jgi:hypothetical protein